MEKSVDRGIQPGKQSIPVLSNSAPVSLATLELEVSGADPVFLKKGRRSRVPNRPNYSLNLWSVLKSSIGKDLSKIPMPVNFSEPLSMLQRLTEDFEYSEILDIAATKEDPCEQMAYVAAFTVSSYASTAVSPSVLSIIMFASLNTPKSSFLQFSDQNGQTI